MANKQPLATDSVLDELLVKLKRKYEFKKRLGIGNFARVFLVQHKLLLKDFALKILDYNYILQVLQREGCENVNQQFETIKNRFINEANIIKDIKHPNIVEIDDLDVLTDKKNIEVPFLVMKYIKGPTLKEKINQEGPLSLGTVLKISENILSALKLIHDRSVIHRDIKPDNIIIEEGTKQAILVDFGIAKDFRKNGKLTALGTILGTPLYMSPEQIDSKPDLNHLTDIYSFGVVLHEMLTGKLPEEVTDIDSKHQKTTGSDAGNIKPELPMGIENIIKKAMHKNPAKRFQNADVFLKKLKEAVMNNKQIDRDLEEVKGKIKDIYTIEGNLNKGGFAKVYLVRHITLDNPRVLKVMRYAYLAEARGFKEVKELRERFLKEGRLLADIKHENIVKVHDIGEAGDNEIPYLIMEYIKGKSLEDLLKEKSPLDFKQALHITEDILSALDEMHSYRTKPIIHRDIKSSNIMIEENTGKAVLIDLGIAKDELDPTNLTVTGSRLGTPIYMSPEQGRGNKDLGPATDIYSLGVVLFEMLTGEVPFKSTKGDAVEVMYAHYHFPAPDVREKNPNLPPGIEQIIFKTMEKEPKARYKNAKEFLKAIKKLKEKYKDYDPSKNIYAREEKSKEKDENKEKIQKKDELQIDREKPVDEQKKMEESKDKTPGQEQIQPGGKDKERKEEAAPKEIKTGKSVGKFFLYFFIPVIIIAGLIIGYLTMKSKGAEPGDQYRELLNSANQYIQTGQYEKAGEVLKNALEIKDSGDVRWLLETVANKQREKMSKEFQAIKVILAGSTANQEKIKTCREFLDQHQNIPPNEQTRNMIKEIESQIDKLENQSKLEEQNRHQIEKMKGDYEKLQEYLKGSAPGDKKIEQCRAFLDTYKEIPATEETTKMISGVQDSLAQFEADIQADINKENRYRAYIKSAKFYINTGNYSKAAKFLQQAKQVNDTPEVEQLADQIESKRLEKERKNGTRTYNVLKDPVNLEKYQEFKSQYPRSDYLPDLQKRVKTADRALPPQEYWDKQIKKNDKGYYELNFGPEHNGHIMIYIPRKDFWIDKYEVSNLQFRNFLKAENQAVPPGKYKEDENPAVVEYEEAVGYCRKYDFKLPTEAEWEYAANGGKNIDYPYPWGNEEPYENGIYRANFDSFDDGFVTPAPVKSFERFSSPYGVVNMAGNVWEWIQGKILKGGGFVSEIQGLKIKNSSTGKSGEKNGFRCIKQ